MIEAYFAQVEKTIQEFPNIRTYTVTQNIYNMKQGMISGSIIFEDETRLDFVEVKNTDNPAKIKYRYHYQSKANAMIFRDDNAPHHRQLKTFPHHQHVSDDVRESQEPTLHEALLEIAQRSRNA